MANTTKEIENKIEKAKNWDEMQKVLQEIPKTTLASRVQELCNKHNVTFRALSGLALVPESTFYAILCGDRAPKKNQIIQIAFALGISLDELNELLKLAKLKELYAKNIDDAIIIYGIKNGLDLGKIDRLLEEKHCAMRFAEFREN